MSTSASQASWRAGLARSYAYYAISFISLIGILAAFESLGLAREWIGYIFLLVTVLMYAAIGIVCRTSDPVEYYVAGRRVPAVFNGMATAAEWMSVASFIGVAGTLYFAGYEGLAYILGWTGGYVLLTLFIAPYLRKFGRYTIPDFLGARFEGDLPRLIGVLCTLACSFTYLVAQIYGVGLITTRLTGITFELGVFIALGSMLICSFLGGMRAVTWTQVGQYIILVVAYLVPVIWLSVSETGRVLPQAAAGQVMPQLVEKQKEINADPAERSVRAYWSSQALLMQMRIDALPASWQDERESLRLHIMRSRASEAPMLEIRRLERSLATYPESVEDAREDWSRQRELFANRAKAPKADNQPSDIEDPVKRSEQRNNFVALLICLMLGTAGLPHILARSLTTPSVAETRQTVFWSLLFILVLYLTAPALAVLVKNQIYQNVVGLSYADLPDWISAWGALDRSLIDVVDINGDGVVQLSEIHLGTDMVVLAGPEIGGMPVVLSGLVAAGAMAAALSTADGLLLAISNALSHDTSFRIVSPHMNSTRQVIMSKVFLLGVAFAAAWVATRTPADIIFMVTAAFSFAAASFFPALVLGIFWKRANYWGVSLGMLAGLGMTFFYMALTQTWLREVCFDIPRSAPVHLWFGIQPNAAGLFGIPLAFLVMVVVSLLTPPPSAKTLALVDYLRRP